MKIYLFLIGILISPILSATHSLGGYISYQYVSGTTYEISVTIYTENGRAANSRKEIEIDWGDNSPRDSIFVDQEEVVPHHTDLLKRTFIERHTFPGVGSYRISVEDPNRIIGINNIANSANVPLYVETSLRIQPFANTDNNSAQVESPLLIEGTIGKKLNFNLSAFDTDQDVLFYELESTKGVGGTTAPGYTKPNSIELDPINGALSWEPTQAGLFAVTVKVYECRENEILSSSLVDLLIQVRANSANYDMQFLGPENWMRDMEGRYVSFVAPNDSLVLDLGYLDLSKQSTNPDINLLTGNTEASLNLIRSSKDSVNKQFKWLVGSNSLSCTPQLFTFRGRNNDGYTEDISLLVYVRDSTLNCDSMCNQNIISVPEISLRKFQYKLNISPNPLSEYSKISIESEVPLKYAEVKIYSTFGKLLEIIKADRNNEFIVHRNQLKAGVYFVSLEQANGRIGSSKLMVVDQ